MNSPRPVPWLPYSSRCPRSNLVTELQHVARMMGTRFAETCGAEVGARPTFVAYSPVMPENTQTPRVLREKMNRQDLVRTEGRLGDGCRRVQPPRSAGFEGPGATETFADAYIFRRSPRRTTPKAGASVQRARKTFTRPRCSDIEMIVDAEIVLLLLVHTLPVCGDSPRR